MTIPPFLVTILYLWGVFAAFLIGMLIGGMMVWNIRMERFESEEFGYDDDPDPIHKDNVIPFQKRA